MKFTQSTKIGQVERFWHHVDVSDKILGREAVKIAHFLMGKSKPYFIDHLDCGDYVVVTNAKKVKVTGKKAEQKMYEHFSGYPGGRSVHPFSQIIKTDPKRIIQEAVAGMLPKNKLRDSMLKRLYVFSDNEHPYASKLATSK